MWQQVVEQIINERFKSKRLSKLCREHDGLMMDDFDRPCVYFNGVNNVRESDITDDMLDDEIQMSIYNNEDNAVHFNDNTYVEFNDDDYTIHKIANIRDNKLRERRMQRRGYGKDTGFHGSHDDEIRPLSTKIHLLKNKYDDYRDIPKENKGKWYNW